MQKLICELCRSNDFTKDDQGFFVCDYCRTKYTPAQAQSMLVEGTVRVDRSGEESSLITIASNALTSGNFQEAFDYANRALEIDPQSSMAWYIKGTAAGWLSTFQVPRLREMQNAFELAIQNAPEDQRSDMQEWCAQRIGEIAPAISGKPPPSKPPHWSVDQSHYTTYATRFPKRVAQIVAEDQNRPLDALTRWELKNLIDYLEAGHEYSYALERTRPKRRR